jgi:CHAD domain-containing protein
VIEAEGDSSSGLIVLGDLAHAAIAQHFAKADQYLDAVLADQDPEDLHQMRVGLRRLRSAVTGFAIALEMPKGATDRAIGRVARILGELRDLDVLRETLRDRYEPQLPEAERDRLDRLFKHLHRQRQTASKRTRKTLTQKQYPRLRQALQTWLAQPTYRPAAAWPIATALPDLLLPELCVFNLHPGWFVQLNFAEPAHHSPDEQVLHDLRKQAKRLRYQMNLADDCYGRDYKKAVADVAKVQSVLGRLQDAAVMTDFLRAGLGKKWPRKVPGLADCLAQDRVTAGQDWQVLRDRLMTAQWRDRTRHLINKPHQ